MHSASSDGMGTVQCDVMVCGSHIHSGPKVVKVGSRWKCIVARFNLMRNWNLLLLNPQCINKFNWFFGRCQWWREAAAATTSARGLPNLSCYCTKPKVHRIQKCLIKISNWPLLDMFVSISAVVAFVSECGKLCNFAFAPAEIYNSKTKSITFTSDKKLCDSLEISIFVFFIPQ